MNSDNSKTCSNCKIVYELSFYISKKSTQESIIYTKVCEKCRLKNKNSIIKRKAKVNQNPELVMCSNCNIIQHADEFVSKTGKRTLKVCHNCRKPKKTEKRIEKKDICYMIDNSNDIAKLGTKFKCKGCNNTFINSNLFNNDTREYCNKCRTNHHCN